jgi:hypothetical protein
MYAGIGAGLGSLMGGVIYERYGCNAMFYTVIILTSISLEIYLETNTRYGIRDTTRNVYYGTIRLYSWIQHARGIGQAVPRWSGGRIRLEEDDQD